VTPCLIAHPYHIYCPELAKLSVRFSVASKHLAMRQPCPVLIFAP